jgi:N-acetylneuraminic acid mutarotase
MELINKLYVGLGVPSTVSTTPFSDWYSYTPDTNAWERKAEFPGGRAQAWSFNIGENIYVGGGVNSTNYSFDVSSSGTARTMGFGPSSIVAPCRLVIANIIVGDYLMKFNGEWTADNDGGYHTISAIYERTTTKAVLHVNGIGYAVIISEEGYHDGLVGADGMLWNTLVFTTLGDAEIYYNSISNTFITKQFKDLWQYNCRYNTWNKIPNQPASISESAWSKSLGFAIGSYGYIINEESGNTFKYLPNSNTWNQVASYPGGNRRYLNKFIIGTVPYVGGGATGSNKYNDWYSYNFLTDTWSSIATFTGTSRIGANVFSASGRGYLVGGFGPTYLNTAYEYIPVLNGWTTAATALGTISYFGNGLSLPDTGYSMLGANGNKAFNQNYKFTGSWQSKAAFTGSSRCFAVGESVSLNTYNNYIYYTTGSMSVCPTLCNLWAIKVNNYDDVFAPTVVGAIPISTLSYWIAPNSIATKYNNSFYPMDIVANNNYVIVNQWRYATGSNDCASGSNYLNIGIRASSGNPLISTWIPQTVYYDSTHSVRFPLGMTLKNDDNNGFIIHGINNSILKTAVVASVAGTIPHLAISSYTELNFVATQYNAATYGIRSALGNTSNVIKMSNSILYITPTAFPNNVSKFYPANTTIIDDTTNIKTEIPEKLYWTQNIKDGE